MSRGNLRIFEITKKVAKWAARPSSRETHSSRPSMERRCYAYADLAKTDVATTPGIPGYATIGLCQGAERESTRPSYRREGCVVFSPLNTLKPRRGTRKAQKSKGLLHISVCSVTVVGRSVCSVVNLLLPQRVRTTDGTDTRFAGHRCTRIQFFLFICVDPCRAKPVSLTSVVVAIVGRP